MATEVEISTSIDTAQSQAGLQGLRKGLRELISLQQQVGKDSVNFQKLQRAINDTEGKIGDLNDSFNTLRGSGVKRVNNSISVFREGLLNADTDKLKIGLQGIGAAMKAIPIFLLIEGVRLLIENFDKVSSFVKELTGNFSAEEVQVRKLTDQFERQVEINNRLIPQLENEVKLLQAQKAPLETILATELKIIDAKIKQLQVQVLVERAKQEEILSNTSLVDSFLLVAGAMTGNLSLTRKVTDEKLKLVSEANTKIQQMLNDIGKLETDAEVKRIQTSQQLAEAELKAREERIKRVQEIIEINRKNEEENERAANEARLAEEKAALDAALKIIEENNAKKNALLDAQREIEAYNEEQFEIKRREQRRRDLDNQIADQRAHQVRTEAEKIADIERQRGIDLANTQLTVDQRVAIIQKAEEQIRAIKFDSIQRDLELTRQYFQVIGSLNDLLNQQQTQQLRELEQEKNQALQDAELRNEQEIRSIQDKTDKELSNESLSSEQRERIRANGANRISKIEYAQKVNQIKLENDFNKKQLEVKKDQFEREKALKIATIAIDTAAAMVKTAAQLGFPVAIPFLVAVGALGATQAAVVGAQKFDDSSFQEIPIPAPPPNVGGSSPSRGGTPESARQTFDPNATNNTGQGERRVVVLESDISETIQKVEVLESRATLGE